MSPMGINSFLTVCNKLVEWWEGNIVVADERKPRYYVRTAARRLQSANTPAKCLFIYIQFFQYIFFTSRLDVFTDDVICNAIYIITIICYVLRPCTRFYIAVPIDFVVLRHFHFYLVFHVHEYMTQTYIYIYVYFIGLVIDMSSQSSPHWQKSYICINLRCT